jgi:thiopurine S-methyltransferase
MCALPRRLWPNWGRRTAELVRPRGELAGFFYLDDNQGGPPFGIAPSQLNSLLTMNFQLDEELPIPAEQSLPVFKGKEVWQVWKRRL